MIKLGTGFGSAFTFFDGKDLWNGVWVRRRTPPDSKVYRLDMALFDREGVNVDKDVALEILPVPILAQGGAFRPAGKPVDRGQLRPEDFVPRTGRPQERRRSWRATRCRSRIENIVFDKDNRLWAISESGSRKYHNAKDPDFPFIFEIDVARLK
jgi:hypothetical protein